MKVHLIPHIAIGLSSLLLAGCPAAPGGATSSGPAPAEWAVTSLAAADCREEPDRSDPNETPVRVCPGVGGYRLALRKVDAGRKSVDVVDPSGRRLPLRYHEVVTRHMATLGGAAHWRVAAGKGQPEVTALAIAVQVHEDAAEPDRASAARMVIAKLGADGACVVAQGSPGDAVTLDWRQGVDRALQSPCVPDLPALAAPTGR